MSKLQNRNLIAEGHAWRIVERYADDGGDDKWHVLTLEEKSGSDALGEDVWDQVAEICPIFNGRDGHFGGGILTIGALTVGQREFDRGAEGESITLLRVIADFVMGRATQHERAEAPDWAKAIMRQRIVPIKRVEDMDL